VSGFYPLDKLTVNMMLLRLIDAAPCVNHFNGQTAVLRDELDLN
jgi:hypothetical protein